MCDCSVNKNSVLVHKSRTHLEGMVEDPMFTIVFMLIYELGEPRIASDRMVRYITQESDNSNRLKRILLWLTCFSFLESFLRNLNWSLELCLAILTFLYSTLFCMAALQILLYLYNKIQNVTVLLHNQLFLCLCTPAVLL